MSKSSKNEEINLIGSQLFNQKKKVKVKRFTDKYNNPPFNLYNTDYNIYLLLDNQYVKAASKSVPFLKIESTPIFPGCRGTYIELRKCMNQSIYKIIGKNFNVNLANNLGLSAGKKRIITEFTIDKKGLITNVSAKAPHIKLEEEAIRIIKLLPKMTAGKQEGKPVGVKYKIPIVFNIEDTPIMESRHQKK